MQRALSSYDSAVVSAGVSLEEALGSECGFKEINAEESNTLEIRARLNALVSEVNCIPFQFRRN